MYYAFGDIHGMANHLECALKWAESRAASEDVFVFLGDYIDRGPDSKHVVENLLALGERRPNTVFLFGNHEDLLSRAYNGMRFECDTDDLYDSRPAADWMVNGGDRTLRSYGTEKSIDIIPGEHLEFLMRRPLEHVVDDFYFVHAGLLPAGHVWEFGADLDPRIWIREQFLYSHDDFGRIVVFGHTIQHTRKPLVWCNKVGLDTGAFYYKCLSVGLFTPGDRSGFGLFQVVGDSNGKVVPMSEEVERIDIPV